MGLKLITNQLSNWYSSRYSTSTWWYTYYTLMLYYFVGAVTPQQHLAIWNSFSKGHFLCCSRD